MEFVIGFEQQLPADERAWSSTEILESLFGRFKRIERQHSKGGFTRLLAASGHPYPEQRLRVIT